MKASRFAFGTLIALFLMTSPPAFAKANVSDDYLAGYINALMKFELHQENITVDVKQGHVTLTGFLDQNGQMQAAMKLQNIDGVRKLSFANALVKKPATTKPVVTEARMKATPRLASGSSNPGNPDLWSRRLLFAPAIADPRSPRFSAGWQNYMGNNKLGSVGSVSFGETLSLTDIMRDGERQPWNIRDGAFDVNFQGAVFSIFDLEGISKDLVNSDFWAAIALSWRQRTDFGDFSAMSRVFHQSSHLGDEYILFNKITEQDRVNLSYEGVDLTMAWQPGPKYGLKFYGGGGYLFGRDPSSLDPWSAKIGMEYESTKEKWGMYPLAAVHVQTFEDTGFAPDLSLAGGLQFNHPDKEDRQIRMLLSYFNGHSPNGQFYDEQLEYVGLGFQYQF